MLNTYLYPPAYEGADVATIQENLSELNDILNDIDTDFEHFLYSDDFYEVNTESGEMSSVIYEAAFPNPQFAFNVAPILFQRLENAPEFASKAELDEFFADEYNALFGISFPEKEAFHVTDEDAYNSFKGDVVTHLPDAEKVMKAWNLIFKRVVMCDEAREQFLHTAYFKQVYDDLIELERFCKTYWKSETFPLNAAKENTNFTISQESASTMAQDKLRAIRTFSLPDGSRDVFELHIKGGNYRMHILPRAGKVYVGYIGKHLAVSGGK